MLITSYLHYIKAGQTYPEVLATLNVIHKTGCARRSSSDGVRCTSTRNDRFIYVYLCTLNNYLPTLTHTLIIDPNIYPSIYPSTAAPIYNCLAKC